MSYIEFKDVKKTYQVDKIEIKALDGVDFTIEQGEFVIITGTSGAGKSTILNILGGMDTCTSGEITIDGKKIDQVDQKELTEYRRNDIGFVFQFYNLVQNLTVVENVELATEICKEPLDAKKVIQKVGLENRMNNFPSQISGGEQQRVAIARAVAKNPKVLLCDEPTGALDSKTSQQILELLQDNSKIFKKTVIVITHNLAICPMGDKVIRVKNGKIDSIEINENPKFAEEIEW
ncbi:MAG: ABC transporter ATP-binding protein [Eubacteriales bacterium]